MSPVWLLVIVLIVFVAVGAIGYAWSALIEWHEGREP